MFTFSRREAGWSGVLGVGGGTGDGEGEIHCILLLERRQKRKAYCFLREVP